MKADLHIHTLLSPCGDIEMTPAAIVRIALEKGLGIIGITDHNSTRQAPIIKEIGNREGLYVLCGAEITTKEEVHVLAFVEGDEKLLSLQEYLSAKLIKVPNNPDYFGYQLVVNEQEGIVYQEDNLLIGAIDASIDQIARFVHSLDGIFIPAHIDKKSNSLLSQLGFVPPEMEADAFELSSNCNQDNFFLVNSGLTGKNFICSSDAHYPEDIGRCCTNLDIEELSFGSILKALRQSSVNDFVRN